MSFQNTEVETEIEEAVEQYAKPEMPTDFEKWIMQCCKAPEWQLRSYLKKVLTRAGFEIFEDEYKSERCSKESRYGTVHNMLAIRGKPSVCLVAHTDVCRDHDELRNDGKYGNGEYSWWMHGRHMDEEAVEKNSGPVKVDPVLRLVEHEGSIHRIITDRNNRVQVGGDDRLGVAINTYIALNTGYDMGLLFVTDEEIGLKSARACEMQRLKEFDLLIQTDRGNHSDELVIKIGSQILIDYQNACRLLEIAFDIGCPRSPITGMSTDVYALKSRDMCKNAVNLTVGYHNSFGSSANEYIETTEARDAMKFVAACIRDYYLNGSTK